MSYGDVSIVYDMKRLRKAGLLEIEIDMVIVQRIQNQYPEISRRKAEAIVDNIKRYGIGKWNKVLIEK